MFAVQRLESFKFLKTTPDDGMCHWFSGLFNKQTPTDQQPKRLKLKINIFIYNLLFSARSALIASPKSVIDWSKILSFIKINSWTFSCLTWNYVAVAIDIWLKLQSKENEKIIKIFKLLWVKSILMWFEPNESLTSMVLCNPLNQRLSGCENSSQLNVLLILL